MALSAAASVLCLPKSPQQKVAWGLELQLHWEKSRAFTKSFGYLQHYFTDSKGSEICTMRRSKK